MTDDRPPGTVKSDLTLLSILRTVRESDGVRLTDIADTLGLAKSTVHGHLETLATDGFITKRDGEYHLGLRFLDYGIQARNRRRIYEAAQPMVSKLAAGTGERTWCIVEENLHAVYLCGATGDNTVKTPHRAGRHSELHHLAGGKAILAHLSEDRVAEITEVTGLPRVTEHTITDYDELVEELERVRARGVAYNLEESMEGLHAIAAPVKRMDGGVHGAISISGPANRMTQARFDDELADLLLGATNEIEINLREF